MMLLCAGMAIDSLPLSHQLTTALVENWQVLMSAVPG
jgi:heme o synthase